EHAGVLHDELDMQSFLGRVRVDGAPPVGRIGPIYGTVLALGFGSGFAIDQAVAFDDMQRLAVGGAESIDCREWRDLDTNCVNHQRVALVAADRVALPARGQVLGMSPIQANM